MASLQGRGVRATSLLALAAWTAGAACAGSSPPAPADDAGADAEALPDAGADGGPDAGPDDVELQVLERTNGTCWDIEDLVIPDALHVAARVQLDESGRPLVVTDSARGRSDTTLRSNVRLFRKDDGLWQHEDVLAEDFAAGRSPRYQEPRVAQGPSGELRLLVGRNEEHDPGEPPAAMHTVLQGTRVGPGDWPLAPVPTEARATGVELGVDADGVVHVLLAQSRLVQASDSLHLARRAPGEEWSVEVVVEDGVQRTNPAMAVSERGEPHVLYQDRCPVTREADCGEQLFPQIDPLLYGTKESGSWAFAIYGMAVRHAQSALAVDRDGAVHLVYVGADAVTYLSNRKGRWITESVLDRRRHYVWTSIAVDDTGAAHLVVGGTRGAEDGELLMYATNRGGDWLVEEVDATVGTNGRPTIAVDADGIPHVAYGHLQLLEGALTPHASYATRCAAP